MNWQTSQCQHFRSRKFTRALPDQRGKLRCSWDHTTSPKSRITQPVVHQSKGKVIHHPDPRKGEQARLESVTTLFHFAEAVSIVISRGEISNLTRHASCHCPDCTPRNCARLSESESRGESTGASNSRIVRDWSSSTEKNRRGEFGPRVLLRAGYWKWKWKRNDRTESGSPADNRRGILWWKCSFRSIANYENDEMIDFE